jgi:hypothetical protein
VRKVCANDSSSKNTMVIDIMSIGLVTMDGISDVGVAVDIIMSNKEGEWHPYEITGDIHKCPRRQHQPPSDVDV